MASIDDQDASMKQPRSRPKWHRLLCVLLFFGPSILLAFLIATDTDVEPIVLIQPMGMRAITLVDAALVVTPLFFLVLSCSVAIMGERKYRLPWICCLVAGMVVQCVVSMLIGAFVHLLLYGFDEGVF